MSFIPMGMMLGADIGFGDFLWKNLLPGMKNKNKNKNKHKHTHKHTNTHTNTHTHINTQIHSYNRKWNRRNNGCWFNLLVCLFI